MRARRIGSYLALLAALTACGSSPVSFARRDPPEPTIPITLFPPPGAPPRLAPTTVAPTTTVTSATATATATAAPTVAPATARPTTAAPPPRSTVPPASAPAPDASRTPAPTIDAAAWAVLDPATGEVIAGRDVHRRRPVGSLMKLLTALVVLQAGDLDGVVTAPDDLIRSADESVIGVRSGERLARRTLLLAMLVASANDAARALAVDLALSEEAFAERMTAAGEAIGLARTTALNATGLDADGSLSTARDMAVLADVLMDDPRFASTVARTSLELHGQTFPTTNDLLASFPGADGVKTGRTSGAAWCVVASATRDGERVIVAVLGAPSEAARDAGAIALLDWGLS